MPLADTSLKLILKEPTIGIRKNNINPTNHGVIKPKPLSALLCLYLSCFKIYTPIL